MVESGGIPLEETREESMDRVSCLDMSTGVRVVHRTSCLGSSHGGCMYFLPLVLEGHQHDWGDSSSSRSNRLTLPGLEPPNMGSYTSEPLPTIMAVLDAFCITVLVHDG